jgi:hypothetical protein
VFWSISKKIDDDTEGCALNTYIQWKIFHAPGARDRAEQGKPGRRKLIKIQGQLIVMAKGLHPLRFDLPSCCRSKKKQPDGEPIVCQNRFHRTVLEA